MGTIKAVTGRIAVLTAVGLAGLAVAGAPALAHVEIDADNVSSSGATITFTAEAESQTAGIDGLRTFLPQGIAPASVSLASGPTGWTLIKQTDGFTVSGAALKVGQQARYSVIMTLPQGVQRFSMRTVQHYSDGTTQKWVTPSTGDPEAPGVAPILDLNPPTPGPVQEVTEAAPSVLGLAISTRTIVFGGLLAAALLMGFFWIRTRMA